MRFELEFDQEELQRMAIDKATDELARRILSEEWSHDRRMFNRAIRDMIDEICIKKRDEMYDAVVEKVADKIARKVMKDNKEEMIKLILGE